MLGALWTVSVNCKATLGEDTDYYFVAPFDCSLFHVSACNLSGVSCAVQIKNTTDSSTLTDDIAIGEGTTPTEVTITEMTGDQYPHVDAGDVLHIDLDDTDADDILVILTFTVG